MPSNWLKKKKENYPENWDEISRKFRESRDFTCQMCHTRQGTWRISKKGKPYKSKSAGCHIDPYDTANPDAELICLCEVCHCVFDNEFQAAILEGDHQVVMHSIALGHEGYEEPRPWCDECRGFYLRHEH